MGVDLFGEEGWGGDVAVPTFGPVLEWDEPGDAVIAVRFGTDLSADAGEAVAVAVGGEGEGLADAQAESGL
ncbi:hypothetical protein ACIO3O_12780 [Streptomyces sp. NPDC087440]|uniref:hypothetical protein n=1 Tax=Streptomyces sp. NPDC087440 TaxID=3365790 RepID=UPI0037F2851B